MAAACWNEIHHININDLLFALGLRGGRSSADQEPGRKSRKAAGKHGRILEKESLEEAGREAERTQPLKPCQADLCLGRAVRMEKLLDKRVALQEELIRARRRRAAASSRASISEAARDEKLEELEEISNMTKSGESTMQSLRDALASMKAHYEALGEALRELSIDRARQRREETALSLPAHLRRTLPSSLAEAKRGLNFCTHSSRATRSAGGLETVYAILEDGMPGGRIETRGENSSARAAYKQGAYSAPYPDFDQENFAVWPATPPRYRVGTGAKFPRLQLPVSPIRCYSSVGGVATLNEGEICTRRDRQKARLRRRAKEWWKAADSIDSGCKFCRSPKSTWQPNAQLGGVD